mmetsp:Transcript_11233/g.10855  ORF Transcript_11233/g.10855 Transcript_11233/m.10855 type:complete len:203 (-) Transcript_11233:1155-1763(-)
MTGFSLDKALISLHIRSEAKADPPGESIRMITAFTLESALACLTCSIRVSLPSDLPFTPEPLLPLPMPPTALITTILGPPRTSLSCNPSKILSPFLIFLKYSPAAINLPSKYWFLRCVCFIFFIALFFSFFSSSLNSLVSIILFLLGLFMNSFSNVKSAQSFALASFSTTESSSSLAALPNTHLQKLGFFSFLYVFFTILST